MSDDAKEEQANAAPEGDSFTPAPPPPALSAEEAAAAAATTAAAAGQTSGDTILPDGTVAVPQDTAKRALEAVQILVENNRSASQQLESLMGIVLDAAEVANRSASAVATTGTHVNKAAEKLIEGAKKTGNQAKVVLALAAAVLVGTAGTFSFMTVQLHGKVEQLDEMLLAVGKRAVDLKRRMETMDDIHASLEELNLKQDNTQSVQQAIEDKIARLFESGVSPTRKDKSATPAEAPAKPETPPKSEKPPKPEQKAETKAQSKSERANKSDGKTNASPKTVSVKKPAKTESDDAALLQQLTGLDALLKEQARAVKELSSQVNNLQGSVATVDVIKKDVESIAALQKQREKEAAQREKEAVQELAAANARREKEVKEKERELARERERAREREAAKERELAREREAAKERDLARERELAKDRGKGKDKDRAVSYNREQSKPNAAASVDGMPSYAKPASKTE